jgi:hypothetical protein
MIPMLRPVLALLLSVPLLSACGGADTPAPESEDFPAETAAEAEVAAVRILSPADGAVLEGSEVRVVLEAVGARVAAVAESLPGTVHHHLFVNQDVTPVGEVIPMNQPGIIHMGDGSSEYTLVDLAPGEYRIIAVLADLAHVPLNPPAVDTIFVTVR